MDNWITATQGQIVRAADDPLVVDLGFGATPVTVLELARRLTRVREDVRLVGVEIDPARVAAAAPSADPPRLDFVHGGFEMAGLRPVLVRAANVLRQYDESTAAAAWQLMIDRVAPGGVVVEGTCDEIGRRGAWILLDGNGPVSLTMVCRVENITRPSDLAERLPKALIHRNVPGEPVHKLLQAMDRAWDSAAPHTVFGARQRWMRMCALLASDWPVDTRRSRYGELTVPWTRVA